MPVFSNPLRSDCKGNPCGVSRDDPDAGADAVAALNITRFGVANYVDTRPTLTAANASGESTAATMWGGAIKSLEQSMPVEFSSQFSAMDAINVVGTIGVDQAHVGMNGRTHVVIDGGALGFFQIDPTGNYVPWDGDIATLAGTSEPRPLLAREELRAVKGLRFIDLGHHRYQYQYLHCLFGGWHQQPGVQRNANTDYDCAVSINDCYVARCAACRCSTPGP